MLNIRITHINVPINCQLLVIVFNHHLVDEIIQCLYTLFQIQTKQIIAIRNNPQTIYLTVILVFQFYHFTYLLFIDQQRIVAVNELDLQFYIFAPIPDILKLFCPSNYRLSTDIADHIFHLLLLILLLQLFLRSPCQKVIHQYEVFVKLLK